MRIVVLVKPVPDPASAGERLGPDGRLDRAAVPAVVNGNDEYVLEAALKLVEAAGEGEITLLSMAPTNAPETLRKALAMGATRAVHVTDPALAGSDHVSTAKVLAAALGTLEYDMVFAGIDSSDGVGGVVPAGDRGPSRTSVPLVRREDRARHGEPDRPCPAHQRDRLRRARGATPRGHRRDPGTRRAALPVAEGDHGGARTRRSSRSRWRISGSMRRGSVAPARPPRSSTAGSHRPGLPRRSSAEHRPKAAARIVDFLAERRLI